MIPSRHEDHQAPGAHVPLLPRRVRSARCPSRALPALPQAADMTPAADRITAYFFGAVAFGCFGAAGYLLMRWWMGQ